MCTAKNVQFTENYEKTYNCPLDPITRYTQLSTGSHHILNILMYLFLMPCLPFHTVTPMSVLFTSQDTVMVADYSNILVNMILTSEECSIVWIHNLRNLWLTRDLFLLAATTMPLGTDCSPFPTVCPGALPELSPVSYTHLRAHET